MDPIKVVKVDNPLDSDNPILVRPEEVSKPVDGFECPECGSLYLEDLFQCPFCGYMKEEINVNDGSDTR